MDIDWVYRYFDVMSKHFVKSLLAKGVFPDATTRWTALGYSFEDAMFRRFLMYAPFLHSEDAADHTLVDDNLARMRKEVEAYSGQRDPGRDTRERDRQDVLLFARMIKGMENGQGPPKTFAEFFFWIIFDAHYPIVAKYGRYPYRNDGNARKYTEEEKEFMKLTDGFKRAPMIKEEVKRLAEHVKNGTWEERSDQRPLK
ncbi:hypothetical protein CPB85DRAFT_789663 [Mucidula mucida]|nr:hypothetical protein CPB85DRAFT_789663 [Mucidula mucida]